SGTTGSLTWTLENGTLTISGAGEMEDYELQGAPWYPDRSSITNAIIEDGVASIGDYAFYLCQNLISATIPESVTRIGRQSFYQCENLISISIPENVESIGEWAFARCSSLIAIPVENGNARFLSDGGDLFDKDKTTLLCCPAGKTGRYIIPDGVTGIGNGAFYGCGRLTSIIIPEGITGIGDYAFSRCSNLTSIVIPEGVTGIGEGTFNVCSRLGFVIIPESVTGIGWGAFIECTALRDVAVFWDAPSEVSLGENIFSDVDTHNIRLHIPLRTEAAYRTADVWKDFDMEEVQQKSLLKNLTVSAMNLFIEFNPFVFHYTISVPRSIENITLQATPADGATVSGDGQQTLIIGENTAEITVTSPEGVSVYTVAITRLTVDYELHPLFYAEDKTGLTTVTVSGFEPYPVIDKIQLKYRLTTIESGSLPLHFDVGHGKTLDTIVEVNANSIYEFTLHLGLQYYETSGSLSSWIHYDGNGHPFYVTLIYKRYENTVTASSGSEELSACSFYMPGDNIKTVAISALTFIGNITPSAIAEPDAQPAIAVAPNPASDYITVSGLQAGQTLRFFDQYGRLLLTQTAKGESETITVRDLPQGVYIVRVNGQTVKIIKN
ncbi:MAG: leucine-rich repeat protein, partial [Dysgonamonadaceae bacterium]|nr:leucine-rich repeat protein [Dysgonamonadaceae bacterium]